MSRATTCALCGEQDPFALGLCPACAHGDPHLLFVAGKVTPTAFRMADEQLGLGLNLTGGIADALAGNRPLLAVPAPAAAFARARFAAQDLPVRAIELSQVWHRIPAGFYTMLLAVVCAGMLAGTTTVPLLFWGSPAVALLLWWAAWQELRRPTLLFAPSTAALPQHARRALTTALGELPQGAERQQVLDLARLGETALAAMPEAFRRADLGRSVADLVALGSEAALEAWRLDEIEHVDGTSGDLEQQASTAIARREQLARALHLLGEIGRQSVDAPESAGAGIAQLVEEVRGNADHRTYAENTVNALMSRRG